MNDILAALALVIAGQALRINALEGELAQIKGKETKEDETVSRIQRQD